MSLSQKDTLKLTYLGEDSWSRPLYRDQHQHLWKDVGCGMTAHPSLYPSANNEFDGEPDMPIEQEHVIISQPDNEGKKFEYMMLDRLRCDCEYYLGYGNRNAEVLWSKNPREHIEAMKTRWLSFAENEKPQWLTWEQILEFEKQMCETEEDILS